MEYNYTIKDGSLLVENASNLTPETLEKIILAVKEQQPDANITSQTPVIDSDTNEVLYGSASIRDVGAAVRNVPSDATQVLTDLAEAVTNPLETAKTLGKTAVGLGQKAIPGDVVGEFMGMPNYEAYPEAVGERYVERYAPSDNPNQSLLSNVYGSLINEPVTTLMDFSPLGLLKKGVTVPGAKKSDVASTVVEPITPALDLLGGAARAVTPTNVVKNTLQGALGLLTPKKVSEKLMESATKFRVNKARGLEDKNILNQEMLKRNLKPDADSVDIVTARLKNIGQEITQVLDDVVMEGGPNAMVPLSKVFDGLEALKDKYRGVKLDGPDNLKAIDDIVEKLKNEQLLDKVDANTAQITVKQMNNFKQSVYDKLYDKAVKDITKPKDRAYSLLARNAKEAVSERVPKIDAVNKEYGLLSDLRFPLEQAAGRVGNNNVVSFPGLIGGGAAFAVTMDPIITALVAASLNPMNKARLANYLGAMKFQGMTPVLFKNSVLPTLIEQGVYQPSQIQEAMDDFEKARAEELSE